MTLGAISPVSRSPSPPTRSDVDHWSGQLVCPTRALFTGEVCSSASICVPVDVVGCCGCKIYIDPMNDCDVLHGVADPEVASIRVRLCELKWRR